MTLADLAQGRRPGRALTLAAFKKGIVLADRLHPPGLGFGKLAEFGIEGFAGEVKDENLAGIASH